MQCLILSKVKTGLELLIVYCGNGELVCVWLQEKSYFALALPHGWWLFGLDLALVDDIDMCQCRLESEPHFCLLRVTQPVYADLPALGSLPGVLCLGTPSTAHTPVLHNSCKLETSHLEMN